MAISLLVNEYNKHFNKYRENMTSLTYDYDTITYNIADVSGEHDDLIATVDSSHTERVNGRLLSKNITNINAQINDSNQQYKVANNLNYMYNLFIIIAIVAILLFTFINPSK